MATCQFCGRQFTNTQAVRAHLKACAVYHGRDQATGSALGRVALGTVPEAADAGTELPNGEAARDGQKGAARLRAQERADRQTFREAEEFLRREAAERRARQRRALIQSVKEEVVGYGSSQHPTIPAEVKAEALQEIERKLSALSHIDELPRRELVQIAEGIRDRLFRPVLEAQEATRQRARADEDEARRRARADEEARRRAKIEEEAARQQAEAAAQERAEAKQRVVECGMSVADRELRADPDLEPGERQDIREWVQSVLKEELSGAESNEQVNDLVNHLLDEAYDADNDQDEDEEESDDFDDDEDDDDD